MLQIAFVSDQHNDNVTVGVITKFFQPPSHILICLMFADVVDEKSADSAAIVCRRNGSVALLACSVPNLCFDGLGVDGDGSCGELDSDS